MRARFAWGFAAFLSSLDTPTRPNIPHAHLQTCSHAHCQRKLAKPTCLLRVLRAIWKSSRASSHTVGFPLRQQATVKSNSRKCRKMGRRSSAMANPRSRKRAVRNVRIPEMVASALYPSRRPAASLVSLGHRTRKSAERTRERKIARHHQGAFWRETQTNSTIQTDQTICLQTTSCQSRTSLSLLVLRDVCRSWPSGLRCASRLCPLDPQLDHQDVQRKCLLVCVGRRNEIARG